MGVHVTSINGMGASTLSGSTITNTGMGVQDHMQVSQDYVDIGGVSDFPNAHLQVIQHSTPNMSVDVSVGYGYVPNVGYSVPSVSVNAYFRITNDATYNIAINSNSSGNPRITSIFAKINVAVAPDGTASNVGSFVAVDGTPAATPAAPAAPADGNSYLRLADVTVANGASSIVTANISDQRYQSALRVQNGWESANETWTFGAADSPSFTVTITGDKSKKYQAGMKVSLVQSASTLYFIITAVTVAGGNTTLNLYGGTDYTLANAAITFPRYSSAKTPYGFPVFEDKWTVTLINNSASQLQGSVTQNTWYNPGSLSGAVPIGRWKINYSLALTCTRNRTSTTAAGPDTYVTLSTANNSESNSNFTKYANGNNLAGLSSASYTETIFAGIYTTLTNVLDLAAKTTHFLNVRSTTATDTLTNAGFRGDLIPTVVKLVCAYL